MNTCNFTLPRTELTNNMATDEEIAELSLAITAISDNLCDLPEAPYSMLTNISQKQIKWLENR